MKKFSSFWVMKDVIGKILDELLKKEGAPTRDDFAGMLGISVKTLYNVTKGRSSLTFDQVIKASEILNFDIAEEYYKRTGKSEKINRLAEGNGVYRKKSNQITVGISVSGSLTSFENFPALLNKIRNEAIELGFEIE